MSRHLVISFVNDMHRCFSEAKVFCTEYDFDKIYMDISVAFPSSDRLGRRTWIILEAVQIIGSIISSPS